MCWKFCLLIGISWTCGSMAIGTRCCRTDGVTCEGFLWGGGPSSGVCFWCPWARIGYSRNSRDRLIRLEEKHRVSIRLDSSQFLQNVSWRQYFIYAKAGVRNWYLFHFKAYSLQSLQLFYNAVSIVSEFFPYKSFAVIYAHIVITNCMFWQVEWNHRSCH